MGARQEFFKEELAGSIQRRLFKAQLKGESMVVSPRMKLIIPLTKFNHVTTLLNTIHDFDSFEWNDNRARHGGLSYAGHPVAERITDSYFYLRDDWQIYHRNRHFIRHMGWIEMDNKNNLINVFNYFAPLGLYGENDYIEIVKLDGEIVEHKIPPYDENAEGSNGFIVNTTKAKHICHCVVENKKVVKQINIPNVIGVPIEKLSLQGNCVKYPVR